VILLLFKVLISTTCFKLVVTRQPDQKVLMNAFSFVHDGQHVYEVFALRTKELRFHGWHHATTTATAMGSHRTPMVTGVVVGGGKQGLGRRGKRSAGSEQTRVSRWWGRCRYCVF